MADELIERTQNLLKELELFKTHLEQQRKLGRVEYRHFERDARNELHALQQTIEENEQEKMYVSERYRCRFAPLILPVLDPLSFRSLLLSSFARRSECYIKKRHVDFGVLHSYSCFSKRRYTSVL